MHLEHWYDVLIWWHLGTITPAFFIATYLMCVKKGTRQHRFLGRIYMGLMLFTALVSLLMSAKVGPTLLGHFGFIHVLSLVVFYSVIKAYTAIRKGQVKAHKSHMISLYVGGLLVAGAFTLTPGRMLGNLLFGVG